jgi:hypothetical protein
MCTTICTTANSITTTTAVEGSLNAPVITAQNGMAVRITERKNPFR